MDYNIKFKTTSEGDGGKKTAEELKKVNEEAKKLNEEQKRTGSVVDSVANKLRGGLLNALVFAGLGFKSLIVVVQALRQATAPLSESFDRFTTAVGAAARRSGESSRIIQGLKTALDAVSESLEANAPIKWASLAGNIKASGDAAGEAAGQMRQFAEATKEAAAETAHLDEAVQRALGIFDEELAQKLEDVGLRENISLTKARANITDPVELANKTAEIKRGAEMERGIFRQQAADKKGAAIADAIATQRRRAEDAQAEVPTEEQAAALRQRIAEFQTLGTSLNAERVKGRSLLGIQHTFRELGGDSLGGTLQINKLIQKRPEQRSAEEAALVDFVLRNGGQAGFTGESISNALLASRHAQKSLVSRQSALRATLPATTAEGLETYIQGKQDIANSVMVDASGRINSLTDQGDRIARGRAGERALEPRRNRLMSAEHGLELSGIQQQLQGELGGTQSQLSAAITRLLSASKSSDAAIILKINELTESKRTLEGRISKLRAQVENMHGQ